MNLSQSPIITFIATTDPEEARAFYQDVLGLTLVNDEEFALVFNLNGTMLRIQKVDEFTPHPFTTLGWVVSGISALVRDLTGRGVEMLRDPDLTQDDLGIWAPDAHTRVAWFNDPDGNLLSLTEFTE